MTTGQAPPRRVHRAVVVVLLILAGVVFLVFTFPNPASISGRSWIALGVVVLIAAIGGIAFSWARYFPKARGGRPPLPEPPDSAPRIGVDSKQLIRPGSTRPTHDAKDER
jgi:protein-S-isoprenylcysteine O-methyltransferase Ste14